MKSERDETTKSPSANSGAQSGRHSTTASNEKTRSSFDSRKQRHPTSPRPGLVPTPVVAWQPTHIGGQWSGYTYLGNSAGRIHHQVPLYSFPAHHVQLSSGVNNQAVRSGSGATSPFSVSYQGQAIPGEKLSKTNLYIRGLHSSTTDEDLVNMCKKYGNIVSTKAILDKDTNNKCKGYGFVDFDSPTSAQRAVTALQNQGIQAQMARQQEQDPTNLYLSNLPKTVDEQQLQQLLSCYGRVVSTRVLWDGNGISKGVGFARMESTESCNLAINKLNGQYLSGSSESLLVKFADGGPKKNKGGKMLRSPDLDYYPYEAIRSPPSANSTPPSTARVAPVMGSQMVRHSPSTGGHVQGYTIPSASGVGWVQPQAGYNIAVSPQAIPVWPSQVDSHAIHQHIPHQQTNVLSQQQLTNQMAQMQIGGQCITCVQTIPGYTPQNSWQITQPQTQLHIAESPVIMSASEIQSNYPHIHQATHPHSGTEHYLSEPTATVQN